jgi:predicted phosphodiesterase
MSAKHNFLISLVILFIVAATSSAADFIWDNEAGNGDWNNATNWNPDTVPPSTSGNYAKIFMSTGPIFSAGRTASAYRVYIEGSNGTITMSGGTLSLTSSWIGIGYTSSSDSGTLTMSSGTINTTGISGHIYCGVKGNAILNMSGGAINLSGTVYVGRDPTGVGTVNLSGGTITCGNTLLIGSGGGTGTIDITSTGTLIINGDVTAAIATYVANDQITAYGGAGTVMSDYDVTTTGKTTVWASAPTKAGVPSPADAATNVSTLTDLSWTGMLEATSHDVYFGTVSPGTFQVNQPETTFDPGRLNPNTTYYWRIDEVNEANVVISTGDVWYFITGPVAATNPSPANGATEVSVDSNLSWTAGVTAASHDVYFGTTNPPPFIGNQPETTYNPGTLVVDTTYYWKIDEVEDVCNIYTGSVYSFTTQPAFKKGAYLIYPGDNTQMTVLWQLALTQGCTLAWGTDTSYSLGSTATTEYGTDHQHKYTITGLTPGTKYYYKVTAGTFETTGSFRAAPAADATTVKFFAYGDTRTYPASHSAVCGGMNSTIASDPDYQTILLQTGDWVEADTENNWTNEFFNRSYPAQLQAEATLPIQGCMGNHEGGGTYYTKYWPYPYVAARYWSFDYGPAHVVILDQYTLYTPGSAQYIWLVNDLSTTTKKWKFIVLHQPGWTTGTHPNDASVQNYIQPLCLQYGVSVVFAGHNHVYARAVVDGVHHITAGGGGAPLYNPIAGQPNIVIYEKTLHYCKIAIDGNSMNIQTLRPNGTIVDQFYVEKDEPDFKFVQLTDVQLGMCDGDTGRWQTAVTKINFVNPDFAIDTGDHVQNWSDKPKIALYKSIAEDISPTIPLYHLPGNHDIGDIPTAARYTDYLTEFPNGETVPWYSFTYGNNLFICLDSMVLKNPSGYPDANTAQMSWLQTTLADANDHGYDNILVFMHISLCLVSTTEADQTFNMPLGDGTGIRKQLLDLFHQYGVKAVFSGHYHVNAYVRDGELEIITTNSCTCPLGGQSTDTTGFQIVEVYPNHITHTYRTLNSIVLLAGDYNGDRIVDFKDVDILSEHWLDSGIWP